MKYIINCILNQSSNEAEVLCSHTSDNECGDHSVATKRGIVKILHFRQFYKHFVFVEDADGGRDAEVYARGHSCGASFR